jgi:hypothetical protein
MNAQIPFCLAMLVSIPLAGGCGRIAPSPSPISSIRPIAPVPSGLPQPAPGAPGLPGQPSLPPALSPEGAALLQAMRNKVGSTSGVDVEVRASSRGTYYGGKKVNELRSSSSRSRMIWAKPNKLRAQVIDSTTALMKGAVLVMQGPSQIRVKAGGAFGLFPISMSAADTRLLTNRNHAFIDNHPIAHLQRLTAPGAEWRVVAPLPTAPQATWIEITGARRLDKGLTRELLALEAQTLKPMAVAMYEQEQAVVTFQFTRFQWDVTPNPATFKL